MSIGRLRQGVSDELPGVTIQSFAEAKQPVHGEAAFTGFKHADLLINGAYTLSECFQGPSTGFPNNLDSILYVQVNFLGRMGHITAFLTPSIRTAHRPPLHLKIQSSTAQSSIRRRICSHIAMILHTNKFTRFLHKRVRFLLDYL